MATLAQWMIYGANGYTGRLVAKEAVRLKLKPILAGRRRETVEPIARSLGLEWRAFDLEKPNLEGVDLVLHCAGPFSATSKPMADALLKAGKHYLDITGEIAVFEALFARHQEAVKQGSMVVPGVGFDVVPTDCLGAQLKERLVTATQLQMAMTGTGAVSPGTLKSMLEGFGKGGWVRRNGKLTSVPNFYEMKKIPFSFGERWCTSIPWGDVSNAWYSTGIPNITFYAGVSQKAKWIKPFLPIVRKVVDQPATQTLLKKLIEKYVPGPSEEHLNTGHMHLWGKASDDHGTSVEGWLDVPEGYKLTALTSVHIVQKILGGAVKPGVWLLARI